MGYVTIKASDVPMTSSQWFTELIPLGGPTLVCGEGGTLKSAFCHHIVAAATRGKLNGGTIMGPADVIYFATELDAGRLSAKFEANGADRDRIHMVNFAEMDEPFSVMSKRDMSLLEADVERFGASLIVFDPLSDVFGGRRTNRHEDMSMVMSKLEILAQKHDLAILCVHHSTKAPKNLRGLYTGSAALGDRSRAVLGFARDTETEKYYFQVIKNNEGKDGVAYRLETELRVLPEREDSDGEYIVTGYVEAPSVSLSDILMQNQFRQPESPEKINDDGMKIIEQLRTRGGCESREKVMEALCVNGKRVSSFDKAKRALEKAHVVGSVRFPYFQTYAIWYLKETFPDGQDALNAYRQKYPETINH